MEAMLACGLVERTEKDGTFRTTNMAHSLKGYIELTKGCVVRIWDADKTTLLCGMPVGMGTPAEFINRF